jgi:hypothetical protein
VIERSGRHEETRTPDLYRVKSWSRVGRSDTQEARVIQRVSVHAGFMRVVRPMGVTERYVELLPDMDRDDTVTTQTTTQTGQRTRPLRFQPSRSLWNLRIVREFLSAHPGSTLGLQRMIPAPLFRDAAQELHTTLRRRWRSSNASGEASRPWCDCAAS